MRCPDGYDRVLAETIDALRYLTPAATRRVVADLAPALRSQGYDDLADRVRLWAKLSLDPETRSQLDCVSHWAVVAERYWRLQQTRDAWEQYRRWLDYRLSLRRLVPQACVVCGAEYRITAAQRHSRTKQRCARCRRTLPIVGLSRNTVHARLRRGWDREEALGTAPRPLTPSQHAPTTAEELDLAAEHGVHRRLVNERLRRGWDRRKALTEPSGRVATTEEQRRAANANGISARLLRRRLAEGWSVADATSRPSRTGSGTAKQR